MLLVRGVDLVLAVGHELRIASLADVKARCAERGEEEAGYEQEVQLGGYKVCRLISAHNRAITHQACLFARQTLDTPAVNFEIQQLVLNPTSKLLAVVGAHSVAVVVLPRKGWSSAVGRSIECRCVASCSSHSLSGADLPIHGVHTATCSSASTTTPSPAPRPSRKHSGTPGALPLRRFSSSPSMLPYESTALPKTSRSRLKRSPLPPRLRPGHRRLARREDQASASRLMMRRQKWLFRCAWERAKETGALSRYMG